MARLSRNSLCWCKSGKKYKHCCYPEIEPEDNIIIKTAPASSMGTQPIKVLENNIISFFEKTNKQFAKQLDYDVANLDLKAGIGYINEEAKITNSPVAYINSNKQIHIQETFLSYVWIISYCLVSIFDEHILAPRLNRQFFNNPIRLQKKFDFFNYAISLINRFSTWDIDKFPNPAKYAIEDKLYVEKTNSVFLQAVNFVMCHEYSHFSLGHTDLSIDAMVNGTTISDAESKKQECEADENAIKLMVTKPKTKKFKKNIEYGIVAGLSSLIFFNKICVLDNYPDPEIRLKMALEQLNLKDEDLHWGLASLALKIWTNRQNVSLTLPTIVDTYKECFYAILDEIAKVKQSS